MNEYERWQARFSEPGHAFGKGPNYFLTSCAQVLPRSGLALAVGDGEGRNGIWLAEQGLEVLSIDFSPLAQAKARALAAERGVKVNFEIVDVHTWEYPEAAFDVVAEIFTQYCWRALDCVGHGGARQRSRCETVRHELYRRPRIVRCGRNKIGYATFVEAACNGVGIVSAPRPDWPESAPLIEWAKQNANFALMEDGLEDTGGFRTALSAVLNAPCRMPVPASGVAEAVEIIAGIAGIG